MRRSEGIGRQYGACNFDKKCCRKCVKVLLYYCEKTINCIRERVSDSGAGGEMARGIRIVLFIPGLRKLQKGVDIIFRYKVLMIDR